jgi:ligand-binding sensor domain-containing protein/two-component sensor histidine kinase
MNRIISKKGLRFQAAKLMLFLLGIFGELTAQNELYNVDLFTPRDGLAQSQVRAIMQDSRGYLWFGTHSGISRFDGLNFKNFKPGGPEGLRGNFVAAIVEDHKGRIWVATDQGASWFDGRRFINLDRDKKLEKVTCIFEDKSGGIWFGTEDHGLSYLSPQGNLDHKPIRWPDMAESKRTVYAIMQDTTGVLWVGRGNGLYRFDGKTPEKVPGQEEFGSCSIRSIYQALEGGPLWLGTDCGILRLDGDRWTRFGENRGVPHPNVFAVAGSQEGTIWAGTGAGVIFYANGDFHAPSVSSDEEADFRVDAALCDNEGNLWFGTEGSGVLRLSKGTFTVWDVDQGLISNLAKTFLEDEQGRIWMGAYDKGISIFDPEDQTFVGELTERNGLPANDLGYAMQDHRGRFWYTSYTKGVFCLEKGKTVLHLNNENGLPDNETYVLAQGPDKRIWVGSKSRLFVIKDGRFERLYDQRNDGLVDNSIYSLHWDKQGKLWIGTAGGLSIWDGKAFTNYNDIGTNVIAIHEDHRQRVWLATSTGLRLWQGEGFDTIRIDVSTDANNVVSILRSGTNALWLGTELGVYRLDLGIFDETKQLRFDHFTFADGLPSLETNAHASFLDSDGQIWFGTTEGAASCPVSARQQAQLPPPRVNITEVRSNLPLSIAADIDTALGTGLPLDLRVPYSNNRVGFSFIGINHTDPFSVRYRYRLRESQTEEPWSQVTRSTTAEFSRLPPGKYSFEVQAVNREEETSEPVVYPFTIIPAFWQTIWFWGLIAVAVFLAGWLILRDYAARAKARREEERMKFRAEKLQLEQKALYAMMNPHFTFNALQSIQYFIHKQDRISANKFLSRFAKLVRQNLESTQKDAISLGEEVNRLDLYLSLEQMRFKDRFTYEVTVDRNLDITSTMIPPMILQPFVENSIKHGISNMDDGVIEVDIKKTDEDHIMITIRDNGIGVEASKLRHADRPKEHVSRGMEITRDRIALFGKGAGRQHHIDIRELRNAEGSVEGTEVELLLPLVI